MEHTEVVTTRIASPKDIRRKLDILIMGSVKVERNFTYSLKTDNDTKEKNDFVLVPNEKIKFVKMWMGVTSTQFDDEKMAREGKYPSLAVLFSTASLEGGSLTDGDLYVLTYPTGKTYNSPKLIHIPRHGQTVIGSEDMPDENPSIDHSGELGIAAGEIDGTPYIWFKEFAGNGTLLEFPAKPNTVLGKKFFDALTKTS